jgi:hypothetical protein
LDLDSGTLEFRPIKDQWQSKSSHWRLTVSFSPFQAHMVKAHAETNTAQRLVDVRSASFQMLAAQVEPIEYSHFVTVTVDDTLGVMMDLPRFRLQFALVDGLLESQNMREMVIDEDQSSGTMLGLQNQLVLRSKDEGCQTLPRSRSVLVPEGVVTVQEGAAHVAVRIDTAATRRCVYHKYDIDDRLGYLATSATGITTRLYKIYLHALTSHCLSDPLTGRTGTEEAIHELSSAAVKSFQALAETDAALLALIGGLTPRRTYYPAHTNAAQSVSWHTDLPALAQHESFAALASSVIEIGKALQVFRDRGAVNFDPYLSKLERNPLLLRRASRRNAILYPRETAWPLRPELDASYTARDSPMSIQGDASRWASHLATTGNTHVRIALRDRVLRNKVYVSGPTNAFALGYRCVHILSCLLGRGSRSHQLTLA